MATNLSDPNFKVVFITGIGGQGKSGLASHYVTKIVATSPGFEYWDWRDLKEEEHRLHSKLVSILERLTNGTVTPAHCKDQTVEDLAEIFFQHLASRRIVFAFDNIDHYIDPQTFSPAHGMDKFIELALTRNHNSKFVFTCRPQLKRASVGFLQINLGGLSLSDTLALFNAYMISMRQDEKEALAKEAYDLTRGHPLWLNLIAAQAVRGKDNAHRFLDGIKSGHSFDESSILTEKVLKTVWDTLNPNQRALLRAMSETVRAEREEILEKMVSSIMKSNRFTKALRVLKTLNLIVIKSAPGQPDLLELHPLVKTFVKQRYTLGERTPFIALLGKHYNRTIVLLKPKLPELSDLSAFEHWIDKIELDINKEDFRSALASLDEIAHYLLTWGYVEDYLRIANRLFTTIDWSEAAGKKYPFFHRQFAHYIRTTIEFGERDKADSLLNQYEPFAKGSEHAEYCELRSCQYWYQQDFDSAIRWGQWCWDAHQASSPPSNAIPHYLLLAWRDTRQIDNIQKALNGFLDGQQLGDILSSDPANKDLGSAFYGNIRRCLWYLNRLEEALICYKKSICLLGQEKHMSTIINKGYANYWIAQILVKQEDKKNACLFYRRAILRWKHVSPLLARRAEEELDLLLTQSTELKCVKDTPDWEVNRHCEAVLSQIGKNVS